MPVENKADSAEMAQRVGFVFEALCEGVLSRDIPQYVAKKKPEWEVAERTVRRYVQLAMKEFKALAKKHQNREFGKANARLNTLFLRAFRVQDYKTCLSIQKEINALFGLNAPTKLQVDANVTTPPAYDLDKLSLPEKLQLLELSRKAKHDGDSGTT